MRSPFYLCHIRITPAVRYISCLAMVLVCTSNCSEKDSEKVYDTIIIGGGLMGSSAAWHLAKTGQSVLLLEKQSSAYAEGSSQGEARIARSNNRGNDIWSYLHNRSVAETKQLIDSLNKYLPKQPVTIDDLYTTSPVTYVGRNRIYDKLYASLIRQKINYEIASTTEEGRNKFQVDLPEDVLMQREYNTYSGTLNPRKTHSIFT